MLLEKINNEPAESEGIENLASVLVDYVNKEISQLKVCIKVIGDIADFNLYLYFVLCYLNFVNRNAERETVYQSAKPNTADRNDAYLRT